MRLVLHTSRLDQADTRSSGTKNPRSLVLYVAGTSPLGYLQRQALRRDSGLNPLRLGACLEGAGFLIYPLLKIDFSMDEKPRRNSQRGVVDGALEGDGEKAGEKQILLL
jgi:hypothetical protein